MAFLSEFILHLLGRPAVCLQDFNGYNSTFPRGTIPDVILDQDKRGPAVLKIHVSWFFRKKKGSVFPSILFFLLSAISNF